LDNLLRTLVKIAAPASTTTKKVNLLNPLPAAVAVLACTIPITIKLDNFPNLVLAKIAAPASTQILPVLQAPRAVNVPFVPPENGPISKVSPRIINANSVARPENSPINPVLRRMTNAQDDAPAVNTPASSDLLRVTSATTVLQADGPIPLAVLRKAFVKHVMSADTQPEQDWQIQLNAKHVCKDIIKIKMGKLFVFLVFLGNINTNPPKQLANNARPIGFPIKPIKPNAYNVVISKKQNNAEHFAASVMPESTWT
jgi:hypothetical protein